MIDLRSGIVWECSPWSLLDTRHVRKFVGNGEEGGGGGSDPQWKLTLIYQPDRIACITMRCDCVASVARVTMYRDCEKSGPVLTSPSGQGRAGEGGGGLIWREGGDRLIF